MITISVNGTPGFRLWRCRWLGAIVLLPFPLKVLAGYVYTCLWPAAPRVTTTDGLAPMGNLEMLVSACLIAPPLETLLTQTLPFCLWAYTARPLLSNSVWPRRSATAPILASTVLFALMHVFSGWLNVFVLLPLGLALAVLYAQVLQDSRFGTRISPESRHFYAWAWVTLAHALHNLIALIWFFADRGRW